jgi:hypothetical protein
VTIAIKALLYEKIDSRKEEGVKNACHRGSKLICACEEKAEDNLHIHWSEE